MKKNLRILIITVLVLCSSIATCLGANLNELQEKQNEINNQITNKNEELTEVQTEISTVLQQIQEISDKITQYEGEIKTIGKQVNELKTTVEAKEKKLKQAKENYENQRNIVEDRVAVIYEAGETTYLDMLLNTKSLSEFISTFYYISEIINADTELLEDLEREKIKIENETQELEKQKMQLKNLKNSKERTSIVLENSRILQDNYRNQLTEQEKAIQQQIEEYEMQMRQVQAEIVLLATQNLGEDYSGGIMMWPVPGYTTITSQFGMRLHPILHVYKLHTGMDIGAPYGANFVAASDGVVIKAGMNSAYGNMVIIDHGGGVTTLYAHGSEILVTVGQTVKRGEPILKVGSTGYSTGPHAHFEVRINGNCVQPLNFLKRQTTATPTVTPESNENTIGGSNENQIVL